MFNPIKCTWN